MTPENITLNAGAFYAATRDAALVEDLFFAWRDAADDASWAYDRWCVAPSGQAAFDCFHSYRAALHREDAACREYARALGTGS